jgi:hypothetical protein
MLPRPALVLQIPPACAINASLTRLHAFLGFQKACNIFCWRAFCGKPQCTDKKSLCHNNNDNTFLRGDGTAVILDCLCWQIGNYLSRRFLSSLRYSPVSSSLRGGGGGGGLSCCCCSLSSSAMYLASFWPFPVDPMPSSPGRISRYEHPSFTRQTLSPCRSALESAKVSQGYRSGIFLRLIRSLSKLHYSVNDILGHLVHVSACSLRQEGNITTAGTLVNRFISK